MNNHISMKLAINIIYIIFELNYCKKLNINLHIYHGNIKNGIAIPNLNVIFKIKFERQLTDWFKVNWQLKKVFNFPDIYKNEKNNFLKIF